MTDPGMTARIELWLGELHMPSMRRDYRKAAKDVAAAGGDFLAYLHALLEEEVTDRRSRRVQRRLKEARFPQIKRLCDLDAKELPKSISQDLLNELARGDCPHVPVRQWVISFPWTVRYLLARRPALCSAVRRLFLRAVFAHYRERAAEVGIPNGRGGAVNRIQRFGAALNLNDHS